jgi:hypothetical protein
MEKKLKDTFHLGLLLMSVLISPGCQKVINVDLNDASPRIVIEGLITDRRGPYTVSISKSGSYFNEPVLPPVSGATVVITDDIGTIDTLTEFSAGRYLTSGLRGFPGRTYTLKVISEDQEYVGSSTMQGHVNIDSLMLLEAQTQYFIFNGNTHTNLEIHCFFKDPKEKNYYRIKVIENDSVNTTNYELYDDQYTNGQETELRIAYATKGKDYRVELWSLDSQTYEYYRNLEDLLYINPFFGSTPANPKNNLSNGALGYFGACAVSVKTMMIPGGKLKPGK